MDLKSLFLTGALAVPAAGCVTQRPQDPSTAASAPDTGTVDINTREYPYIGYFAALRGAIFERWTYPPEAAKDNHEGAVKVEFKIKKNGQLDGLKVVDSTGHKELDEALLNAVRTAGPFLPLPAEFNRDVLTVTGTFRYVRSQWAPEEPAPKGKKKHRSGAKKGLNIAP